MQWLKTFFMGLLNSQWLKSLFVGAPTVGVKLTVDLFSALVGRIGWNIILERLLTRIMVGCLNWLVTLSTNSIYQATVNDILKDFKDRGLLKAGD
jgi:hypothetical protein